MTADHSQEGFIVEYLSLGNSVKVTAVDPVTMKEVSIVGSPKVSQKQLAELAVRKLQYVLSKDELPRNGMTKDEED